MKRYVVLVLCALISIGGFAIDDVKDLRGMWGLKLDTARVFQASMLAGAATDSMLLPSTTDLAHKGFRNADMTVTNNLSRPYTFVGKALYSKQVEIPAPWKGKYITLLMERTKPTKVWVDGRLAGSNDDISTQQVYDLSALLTPGRHELAILVDNSPYAIPAQVFSSSHAYSESTQTNWNGIIGRFELRAEEPCSIMAVQTVPDIYTPQVKAEVTLRGMGKADSNLRLVLDVVRDDQATSTVEVKEVSAQQTITLPMKGAALWSEFHPARHTLIVTLKRGEEVLSQKTVHFGLRTFSAEGKQFAINGQHTFLRGKHDACVFPLTGHTAMDVETWRHYFQVAKQYGINHYRFHSWCPPEACFEAADIEGIYLQPELPIWGNLSGADDALMTFLLKEGRHIQETYGNHPSFVMFGLGNEMWGPENLSKLLGTFKREFPQILHAAGSNDFLGYQGKLYGEDYLTTCRVGSEPWGSYYTHARASFSFADAYDGGLLNHAYPNTQMNFGSANAETDVPVIGHETGQYQVYPNYAEMQKYVGALEPRNMAVFKERLEKAGMGSQAADFFRASGRWSALLYRADIEMNLRTPHWGGFQLLDLQDYPGQGSAYVGMLDAFMDSKGLISAEEWRQFCNEVVPLAVMEKYCWTNAETLKANVEVANYSANHLTDRVLAWCLQDSKGQMLQEGKQTFTAYQGTLQEAAEIATSLRGVQKAEKLTLSLQIEGTDYRNVYDVWVYPEKHTMDAPADVLVTKDLNTAIKQLQEGGKVLLFPALENLQEQTVGALFQTDYWNYKMFKTICEGNGKPVSPGTMGLLVQNEHPALADFPTEYHTNWQWFPIVKQSRPMVLDRLPADYKPIVQVIDNIERNHKLGLLYEIKVGNGKLLVCMADIEAAQDKPEARQLLQSMLEYVGSDKFQPSLQLTTAELQQLFTARAEEREIEKLGNISY